MSLVSDSLDAFAASLDAHELRYDRRDDGALRIAWGATPVDFVQFVQAERVREGLVNVSVHLTPQVAVPEGLRDETSLFLNKVNWGLKTGNWELDPADGQVVFRLAWVTERPVSTGLAEHYLSLSRWQFNRTAPYVMRIINDGFSAADAYLDYMTQDVGPADGSSTGAN